MNLYSYVNNSPINFTDPWGLWGVQFGDWSIGDNNPTYVFDNSSWFDVEKGAYATIDGMIPFFDPFADRYSSTDKCGNEKVDDSFQWSRKLGATGRNLFIAAGIWRLIGPYSTRGLPKYLQRIRRFIRYDRSHHMKPPGWDGQWINNIRSWFN